MGHNELVGVHNSDYDPASIRTEGLLNRFTDYLPPQDILQKYKTPDPQSLYWREKLQEKYPDADYALRFDHSLGKFIIAPPWHPLCRTPFVSHAADYGTGIFEGLSSEQGKIILFHERMNRMFNRSVPGRRMKLPTHPNEFAQGIVDLVSILGPKINTDTEGKPVRAYIRPQIRLGTGNLAVSVPFGYPVDMSVLAWRWPFYFLNPQQVYQGDGAKLAVLTALPIQRRYALEGKFASSYGDPSIWGEYARELGANEVLCFGPFATEKISNSPTEWTYLTLDEFENNERNAKGWTRMETIGRLAISDVPSAEVLGIKRDGTVLVPPMEVHRLGGTTLQYQIDHMFPQMNLHVQAAPFNLSHITSGEIVGFMMSGNAVKAAPVGQIDVYDENYNCVGPIKLGIPDIVREISNRFENELTGTIQPSDRSLHFPTNWNEGTKVRATFDDFYAPYFS